LSLTFTGFQSLNFQPAEDAPEMFRNLSAVCLFALSIFAAGCTGGSGDAPKTVPVKGTVTVDGKAMGKLGVVFMPEKGKGGKVATGETDSEGHFTLMTNIPGDGAPVGTYSVSITPVEENNPPMPGMEGYKKPGPPPFARKYTDVTKSGLTAAVDKDPAKNDFKFDLTEK
jgi:hypothetical protein